MEDHTKPVTVSLGLAVIHVDLDERSSILTVDAWMRMSWTDPGLKWDPAIFDNVQKMHFGDNTLWKPDILLYNSANEADVDHYGNTHFLVDQDGLVLWVPPGHFKAYCRLNLRMWPFDTQVHFQKICEI